MVKEVAGKETIVEEEHKYVEKMMPTDFVISEKPDIDANESNLDM